MTILAKGRYRAFEARGAAELRAALALRAGAFAADRDGGDGHDARFRHMLVEDVATGEAVCTFRTLSLAGGGEAAASYSARFYGLGPLASVRGPMLEVGRFCVAPGRRDADVLRVAWGALTRLVERERVGMLFGCTSFSGTNPTRYAPVFAYLAERFLAPARWRPRVRAERIVPLAGRAGERVEARLAMVKMPPILRTYLAMGGRVSDHAVIDEEMGTLHVFTGVEVAAIPPNRKKLLRTVAG